MLFMFIPPANSWHNCAFSTPPLCGTDVWAVPPANTFFPNDPYFLGSWTFGIPGVRRVQALKGLCCTSLSWGLVVRSHETLALRSAPSAWRMEAAASSQHRIAQGTRILMVKVSERKGCVAEHDDMGRHGLQLGQYSQQCEV
eukprot:533772-Pelagomonas_calceolata.AAC.17